MYAPAVRFHAVAVVGLIALVAGAAGAQPARAPADKPDWRAPGGGARGVALRGRRLAAEDRAGRQPHDSLGHAADDQARETGTAVRADHDQIRVRLGGGLHDALGRHAGLQERAGAEPATAAGRHAIGQLLLDPPPLVFPHALDLDDGDLRV